MTLRTSVVLLSLVGPLSCSMSPSTAASAAPQSIEVDLWLSTAYLNAPRSNVGCPGCQTSPSSKSNSNNSKQETLSSKDAETSSQLHRSEGPQSNSSSGYASDQSTSNMRSQSASCTGSSGPSAPVIGSRLSLMDSMSESSHTSDQSSLDSMPGSQHDLDSRFDQGSQVSESTESSVTSSRSSQASHSHRKLLQSGASVATAWLQSTGHNAASTGTHTDKCSNTSGHNAPGSSQSPTPSSQGHSQDNSGSSIENQLDQLGSSSDSSYSSNSQYEPQQKIGSWVPGTPDTIVSNAGFVFLDSHAPSSAPTLPNRANMTNKEVAQAIFGGDREPRHDIIYNIPYTWILVAGVVGSLFLLLVLADWCGWNS